MYYINGKLYFYKKKYEIHNDPNDCFFGMLL
jgi:hypothetical protein